MRWSHATRRQAAAFSTTRPPDLVNSIISIYGRLSGRPLFLETRMPLPNNRTLNTADLTAYTPSFGSTPVAAYVRAPFRCRLVKVTGILGGAITTADGTVTVTVNATQVAS